MKISKRLVEQTLATGLPPIDMRYFPCTRTDGETDSSYYAMQILHTVSFGILTPADFRYVAARTDQGNRLAAKALEKVLLELRRRECTAPGSTVMLEIPRTFLADRSLFSFLDGKLRSGDFPDPTRLCLLFPADFLLTDPAVTVPLLGEVRGYGIHIGVAGFGDESTATLRLASFPFETVVLHPSVSALLRDGNTAALSAVVAFVRALGMRAYLPAPAGDTDLAAACAAGITAVYDDSIIREEATLYGQR